MSDRVFLPKTGFLAAFRRDHAKLLLTYDFLVPVQPDYDRRHVEDLIDKANSCYTQHDHKGTLVAAHTAITHLLGADLKRPRSLRDADLHGQQLEMIARCLNRWDKASAWLGRHNPLLPTTLNICLDLRKIFEEYLRDDARVTALASTFAYAYMRQGDYRSAWYWITISLEKATTLQARRDILGAKAGLLHKAGHYHEAIRCYWECIKLDERIGVSRASQGQVLASLGFAEAKVAELASSGERRIEEGLCICREAAHPGFELEIQRERIEHLLSRGDIDAAQAVRREAWSLLDQYPDSFEGSRARLPRVEQLIENAQRPMKKWRHEMRVVYRPLQELLNVARHELEAIHRYTAIALMIEALEIATLLLVLKNGWMSRTEDSKAEFGAPSLRKKNEWLFSKHIYDEETCYKIEELGRLRNRLFHGHLESGRVKLYEPLDYLVDCYNWICSFIKLHGIEDYCLEKSELYKEKQLLY
jgi:tetratricopeptide (TPR) repeat protein